MIKRMFLTAAPAIVDARSNRQIDRGGHSKPRRSLGTVMVGAAAMVLGLLELVTPGALNGGTIPPASAFTPLKVWVQTNFLGSDWVLAIGFVALVALVWSLMHGKGWAGASVVLGILAAALLGPNLVIAAATATREPLPVLISVDQAPQPGAPSHSRSHLPSNPPPILSVQARTTNSKLAASA